MGEQPQIYVKGFSRSAGQQDLKKLFSPYGEVKEVRIIRDYAFIVFNKGEEAHQAADKLNDTIFDDCKLRVEIAGRPKNLRGPQPNDECRQCGKLGHWKNDCPSYRRESRRRRRSYSSSSSSSSSLSDRKHRKKHKSKKISKKHKKRSPSSSSSSSSKSSSPVKNEKKRNDQ